MKYPSPIVLCGVGSCLSAYGGLVALAGYFIVLLSPCRTFHLSGPAAFARWAVSRGFSRLPPPVSFADPCPSPWWSLPVILPPPTFSGDQAEDGSKHSAAVRTGSPFSGQGQSPHSSSAQLPGGQQASSASSPVDYFYYRVLSLILAGFHCF